MATNTQALQKYLDALAKGYEVLAEASTTANERGHRVSQRLSSDISAAQREALEFAKRLANDPEHYMSTAYSGMTEAAIAAQGRAFAFAQIAYQEGLSASNETRSHVERLAEANKNAAEAASELARGWASLNPLSDMFFRAMDEAGKAAGGTGAKSS